MGETRVNLHHLLEDLRDAYPGSLESTILTEVVANALDSGATLIELLTDPSGATLAARDNGIGMGRRELRQFHDLASSTKRRGEGIGFAGVGIKLGLLISDQVTTESRRSGKPNATTWHLATRHRAPWKWTAPAGLVEARGTAVTFQISNPLSPLLDPGFLERNVHQHFAPLLDSRFGEILGDRYPGGVRFEINGRPVESTAGGGGEPLLIRLARKRKPSAVGYLELGPDPLPDDARGVAVSTLGKVIKRGWDWLGLAPALAARVSGVIEVPALASCLTLSKADFLQAGPARAVYLAYRKALQEAVSAQLARWGETPDAAVEAERRRARPVERDMREVLARLARDFPFLASLVEPSPGGKGRAPGARGADGRPDLFSPPDAEPEESPPATPPGPPKSPPATEMRDPKDRSRDRPAHAGLTIQFENLPGAPSLARLVASTVWINEAHPAYRRAQASRSEGYHLALSVALALAPQAVEAARTGEFLEEFLRRWGGVSEQGRRRR